MQQRDQIYDSGEDLSVERIQAFASSIGLKNLPTHYHEFLLRQNGGRVHHAMSDTENEDSLIRLYSVADHDEEKVELVEFDPEESSLPSRFQPALRIGKTWEHELFLSVSDETFGELFLYSLSYDDLETVEATLPELLLSLKPNESGCEVIDPNEIEEQPWVFVRLGHYEELFDAINADFDINSKCPTDKLSRTLLMLAFQCRRRSMVKKLVALGAKADEPDANGMPAIFYSINFLDGIKIAEASGFDLNVTDSHGNNILHILADAIDPFSFSADTRQLTWLVENGVDFKLLNADGDSPKDILEQKVEKFKTHYATQPYMFDYFPASIVEIMRRMS